MADWPLLVPGFPIFYRTTPVGPFGLLFRLACPSWAMLFQEFDKTIYRTPWSFIKTVVISWLSWIPSDGSIRKIPIKSVQYTDDLHWFTGKHHGFLWVSYGFPMGFLWIFLWIFRFQSRWFFSTKLLAWAPRGLRRLVPAPCGPSGTLWNQGARGFAERNAGHWSLVII